MATVNLLKNLKRFNKEVLDTAHGEQIIGGEADGDIMVVDRYQEQMKNEQIDKSKPTKKYHMTLFLTNRRLVAYEARGWLSKDRFAQIPLHELEEISFFCEVRDAKKGGFLKVPYCLTEFIVPDESLYPSLIFKIDIDDILTFDCYRALVSEISKTAQVKIDDYTDYHALREAGLISDDHRSLTTAR